MKKKHLKGFVENLVESYFKTASGTVVADDADVRRIEARTDEAIHVVVGEVLHRAQLFLNRSRHLSHQRRRF